LVANASGGEELAVPPSAADGVLAAPDDYYVDVLEAADAWYELVAQDLEPTATEWGSAHDTLGSAVEALREFEATAGTDVRDEPWGGTRAEMVAVIEAADAWYIAYESDALLAAPTIPVRELARAQVRDEPGVYLWRHDGQAVLRRYGDQPARPRVG
jgi:hypothetical protein